MVTEEPCTFLNRRGQRLAAILTGQMGPQMVVSCHGMLANKDTPRQALLARLLNERGMSSVRFDFAGRGASEGSLYDLSYSNQIEDLDAVINALFARGTQRVAVFGSSMGGSVALLCAGRDERVVAVATLGAVAHLDELGERHPNDVASFLSRGFMETGEGKIGRAFYDDALTQEILPSVRVLRIPIYVVHGEEDEVVPTSDAHDLATAARQARLEIVPGADHGFSKPEHLRPAMAKIADFLGEVLGPRS